MWPTIYKSKPSISLFNIVWLFFGMMIRTMYCHNFKLCSDGFPSLLAATHPELEKHWLLWTYYEWTRLGVVRNDWRKLSSTTRHRLSVMPSPTCQIDFVRPSKSSESYCRKYWKHPWAATAQATKLFCRAVECVDDLPTAALGIHPTDLEIQTTLTHSPLGSPSHWLSAFQSSSGILLCELAELASSTGCLTAAGDIERMWRFPWGYPQSYTIHFDNNVSPCK